METSSTSPRNSTTAVASMVDSMEDGTEKTRIVELMAASASTTELSEYLRDKGMEDLDSAIFNLANQRRYVPADVLEARRLLRRRRIDAIRALAVMEAERTFQPSAWDDVHKATAFTAAKLRDQPDRSQALRGLQAQLDEIDKHHNAAKRIFPSLALQHK